MIALSSLASPEGVVSAPCHEAHLVLESSYSHSDSGSDSSHSEDVLVRAGRRRNHEKWK